MLRSFLALSIISLILLSAGCRRTNPQEASTGSAMYYAVLLSNGSVYFGELEGLGSPYPVLRNVYYVQSNVNQETKAVSNILVRRGRDWHRPDRMIINEKAIVFIEPVGPDSKVAQLIAESKK